jgi:hypothetical protein
VLDRCNRNLVLLFFDGFSSCVSLECFCVISCCSYELPWKVGYCNVFVFCRSGLNLFKFFLARFRFVKFCRRVSFQTWSDIAHLIRLPDIWLMLRKSSAEMIRNTRFFLHLFFGCFKAFWHLGAKRVFYSINSAKRFSLAIN